MSRIDHAAEAMKMMKASLSDPVANHPQGMTASNALVARAQVEATLALVEQQRVANLIALGALEGQAGFDPLGSVNAIGGLKPDIAAALGLTAGQERESDA